MTIWEAMQTPLREVITICMMVLVLLQGYHCLALLRNRNKGALSVAAFIQFVILFSFFFLLLDGIFHYGEPEYPRTWHAPTAAFCSIPALLIIAYEALSFPYLVWEFYVRRRFRETNLTPGSIKETVDLLPAGIAFAREDGSTVLVNLTMQEIANTLTGKLLTDLHPLMEVAKSKGMDKVVYPDGSRVWQFTQDVITEKNQPYVQMTATDVTAQVRIQEDLRGKNQKLQEIKRRLEIYNRQAERIIISRELLNARMQVHNETGHVLLVSRHYMDHPSAIDEEALLNTLKVTNAHLLKEFEEDDTERDLLAEAIEMARAIGVTVSITGRIPEDGEGRTILAAAVSECATNTKKHADGDLLRVNVKEQGGELCFGLTGNGQPTKKPASESGGLLSLRTLVEKAGGSMEVMESPEFTIQIRVPETKN